MCMSLQVRTFLTWQRLHLCHRCQHLVGLFAETEMLTIFGVVHSCCENPTTVQLASEPNKRKS